MLDLKTMMTTFQYKVHVQQYWLSYNKLKTGTNKSKQFIKILTHLEENSIKNNDITKNDHKFKVPALKY